MIEFFVKFLVLALIVEAITEIIVKRDIFQKIREFFEKKSKTLFSLINCGACTSVWVSIGLCYLTDFRIGLISYLSINFLEPLILAFGVHRIATFWHQLYEAIRNGPKLNINTVNVNQTINEISEEI